MASPLVEAFLSRSGHAHTNPASAIPSTDDRARVSRAQTDSSHPHPPPPAPPPGMLGRLRSIRLSIQNLFSPSLEPPPNPSDQPSAVPSHEPPAQPQLGGSGRGGGRNTRRPFNYEMPGHWQFDEESQRDDGQFEQLPRPQTAHNPRRNHTPLAQSQESGSGRRGQPPQPRAPLPAYNRNFLFKEPMLPGFTSNFASPEWSEEHKAAEFDPEIGEEIVNKGKRKANEPPQRLLVCAKCVDALLADHNVREAFIWVLRCGHVLDGKCLTALAEDAELAASASSSTAVQPRSPRRKRGTKARSYVRGRKQPAELKSVVVAEREWMCPVPHCGKLHWSQLVYKDANSAPIWLQKAGCGAIRMFA